MAESLKSVSKDTGYCLMLQRLRIHQHRGHWFDPWAPRVGALQLEKAFVQPQRPSTVKNKVK